MLCGTTFEFMVILLTPPPDRSSFLFSSGMLGVPLPPRAMHGTRQVSSTSRQGRRCEADDAMRSLMTPAVEGDDLGSGMWSVREESSS